RSASASEERGAARVHERAPAALASSSGELRAQLGGRALLRRVPSRRDYASCRTLSSRRFSIAGNRVTKRAARLGARPRARTDRRLGLAVHFVMRTMSADG